jgi:hypothetical protein
VLLILQGLCGLAAVGAAGWPAGHEAAQAHAFEEWARTNGVPVTMIYGQSTWHFIANLNLDGLVGDARGLGGIQLRFSSGG